MRVRTIACSCLLVAASVGGARTLAAASPDCARWIKEYQQGLARRAVLGKKHVVKAAHQLIVPRPHLQRVGTVPGRVRPPKLSPAEMLKRFKVLCGEDLPDEVLPVAFVPTGLEDALIPPVDTPAGDTLAGLTGNGSPPPFAPIDNGGQPNGTQPIFPPNNGGTTTGGTPTGGFPTGGFPGTPIVPPTTTPIVPPTTTPIVPPTTTPITPSPVPEPDTFVLMLTGLGTIPVVLRMRRKFRKA